MLKKHQILLLTLLISACSLPSKALDNPFSMLPEWQLTYFKEPVFDSEIAILETGDKNKQPIILIHGLGQLGMKDWFNIIPTLEKNYHVIALDLPGFGLSGGAKGRFRPTNYAHVIAAVSRNYTTQKPIVMGHSMGGAVALRYAEQYPQRVKQLILVDAAGLLEKSAFIKHIAAFEFGSQLPKVVQQQIEKVNEFSASVVESTTQSNFISHFLQNNDYAWNWLVSDSSNMNAALSLVEEDFSQAVEKIRIPVDIIWGEKDTVAPLRTGKVLNKQMKDARLQIIPDAGHVPMKSHSSQFIDTLHTALNAPRNEQTSIPSNILNKGTVICRGEDAQVYSGYYDALIIESCDNVKLKNITLNALSIKGSVVDIENLSFVSEHNRIVISGSEITMTNADISGNNPLILSGSRLDMAGVTIEASGNGIEVSGGSRISASFCHMSSPNYTGPVHGLYYLSNQIGLE